MNLRSFSYTKFLGQNFLDAGFKSWIITDTTQRSPCGKFDGLSPFGSDCLEKKPQYAFILNSAKPYADDVCNSVRTVVRTVT